jgi:predicted nucleic acid-binding protein
VDSSWLVAISFQESGYRELIELLESQDELFSSGLLEAELRAALVREGLPGDSEILTAISWVLPRRPLSHEITHVLSYGSLRGADLWHVACALFLSPAPRDIAFLTLDSQQMAVAQKVGFRMQ